MLDPLTSARSESQQAVCLRKPGVTPDSPVLTRDLGKPFHLLSLSACVCKGRLSTAGLIVPLAALTKTVFIKVDPDCNY